MLDKSQTFAETSLLPRIDAFGRGEHEVSRVNVVADSSTVQLCLVTADSLRFLNTVQRVRSVDKR